MFIYFFQYPKTFCNLFFVKIFVRVSSSLQIMNKDMNVLWSWGLNEFLVILFDDDVSLLEVFFFASTITLYFNLRFP